MTQSATIVWFRQDLRLTDHPALEAARQRGPVVPLYIWAPQEEGDWPPGAAAKVYLHFSLRSLAESLSKLGSKLIVRRGDSLEQLRAVAEATGADAVFWNRRYEPRAVQRDKRIKQALRDGGINATSFNGSLLFEPWELETREGNPYQVFTPFHRAMQQLPQPEPPTDAPTSLERNPSPWPPSDTIDDLDLLPDVGWDRGIREFWQPGETGAKQRLAKFIGHHIDDYEDNRDRPDVDGTSLLSPRLHHGELSPRQVWHAVNERCGGDGGLGKGPRSFLRELVWREFGYHLLYHFPQTTDRPLREKFADFPWIDMRKGRHTLEDWQKGRTGYPIVDAGMRQLWEIGWMHNRVRMIVASFLVKDLLVPWQAGARWFWDTLVDADLANNTLGWQWAAGCGADAAPYFRIFNPTSQARKFYPDGRYIRRWIDELKHFSDRDVLEPAEESRNGYPGAIIDHSEARDRALSAFDRIKG